MKKKNMIIPISLILFFFLTGASYAQKQNIPKDVYAAIELEFNKKLNNAKKFKEAATDALKNPIEISEDVEVKAKPKARLERRCILDSSAAEARIGILCYRCALYRDEGTCTFQPGSVCISERISDYDYTCHYVASEDQEAIK